MRGRGDAETRVFSRLLRPHAFVPPRAMKLKQLESLLHDVEPFREPDQMLEQTPPARIWRRASWPRRTPTATSRAEPGGPGGGRGVDHRVAANGAAKVTGLDLDPNALDLTRENCAAFDPRSSRARARHPAGRRAATAARDARGDPERRRAGCARATRHDVVPPLGRRTNGHGRGLESILRRRRFALRADTVIRTPVRDAAARRGPGFCAAARAARNAVYSLNKTSTRAHVERHATRALRASSATVLAEPYELPKTHAHHRRESVEIEVDLWRFEPPRDGRVGRGKRESENPSSDDASETESESRASESDSDSDAGEPSGALEKEEKFPELKYAGARGAFCDRRDFEPRRAGRSGGKGARDSRAVRSRGRESAGRGRGGGRSGGGGRAGGGGD